MAEKNLISKKWTAGLEDPVEFERKLKEQTYLMGRLYDLIQSKLNKNYEAKLKKTNYEKTNWDNMMADSIGYSRGLEEIKFLLKYTQDET